MEDPEAAADDGLAFSRHVVGKAETRAEIITIRAIQAVPTRSLRSDDALPGNEIGELVVHFSPRGAVLVAQPEIEREAPGGAPRVLSEKRPRPFAISSAELAHR